VDIGGTFTDAVLLLRDHSTVIGKAFTTPIDPTNGTLAAIEDAAGSISQTLEEVLATAKWVSHGTTVGLNAVLTGTGAKVGLLTTAGFEATLPIAKVNSILGLDEVLQTEAVHWEKPDMLVPRALIKGVPERIDSRGNVLQGLDELAARRVVRELGSHGVEAVAVSLLWSTLNPLHELALSRIVAEELPDVLVSIGSELSNRIGEYERTVTAVLNAYIAPVLRRYLDRLERELRSSGFAGRLLTMSADGGVESSERARRFPIHTLNSGPIAGLAAARDVGRRMGHDNIISTDVGGTSFDVGLIIGGEMQYTRSARIKRHAVSIPVVEVSSIGTGGGSIAWIETATGVLRVGPASAGASPGPICYGRGGDQPTVTDAACILGYIERIGHMSRLRRAAAEREVESKIAGPLGMSVPGAAEGILAIANAQMADLIRRMTVLRGRDPDEFRLYAFGGAAPQFAGRYAAELGVDEVFIPRVASVFSAYGAATSDLLVRVEHETGSLHPGLDREELNRQVKRLEAAALEVVGLGDVDRGPFSLERKAGMRFRRQVHEHNVVMDAKPLSLESAKALESRFRRDYEQVVGRGSAYLEADVEVVSLCVEVRVPLVEHVGPMAAPDSSSKAESRPAARRPAWFGGQQLDCEVFDGNRLEPGSTVHGPAFVELPTTTVVVYPDQQLHTDTEGNMVLSLR
jgi:N-methylhydantoinase A